LVWGGLEGWWVGLGEGGKFEVEQQNNWGHNMLPWMEGRKEAAAARLCMLAKQHTDKKRRSFSQQQEFFFDGKSIQNLIF
jgi:predicted ATPase